MFIEIKKEVEKCFQNLLKAGTLYQVDVDKEKIWEIYLNAFSEEKKQGNQCNNCRSFIRQFAGIVGIKNNERITLWDFEVEDEEYAAPVKAIKKYIKSLPISGLFFAPLPKIGTNKTPDKVRNVIWNHFYLEIPAKFVNKDSGPVEGAARDNKNVLQRSLNEITDDAVDTTLELLSQQSLYRGNEFEGMVKEFKKLKTRYKTIKPGLKDNFCWSESATVSPALSRIKNSAIGTFLMDLSEGRELDAAVTAWEKIMAPSSYKRPTALVTSKMIEDARKRLEELGLTGALNRRMLSDKDLTVNNALFVNRPAKVEDNIFDQIKKEVTVNPKTLSKMEEVNIKDFVEKILPTAKSVKVLVENKHLSNFVSLVGPKEAGDTLFKWGNNFSWSYDGNVADSMKNRVAELGGRVDGVLRFTHSWNHPETGRNASLMDLHVFLPGSSEHKDGIHDHYPNGQRVGWNNRKDAASHGVQDVDYVNAAPVGHVPVENITFPSMKYLKDGKYIFKIHNWQLRSPTTSGFQAEIEFNNEIFQYNHPGPLKNKQWITLAEATLKNGSFTIEHKLDSKASSQTKWNVTTNSYVDVKAITISPNFWNAEIGNKHYFFFLEGCKADSPVRGIYNEFLKEELSKDRKVFEVLGSKIKVEPVENELSGLGFSETVRASLVVEVTGAFKRVIKINF